MNKKYFVLLGILVIVGLTSLYFITNQNSFKQSTAPQVQPTTTIIVATPTIQKQTISEEEAKAFFEKYVKLQNSFDSAFLELYADNYKFKTTRYYLKGEPAQLELTRKQIEQLMPAALQLGKQRNDTNTYSDIDYQISEDYAKVIAKRFNNYKNYSAEYYMLIINQGGELKIVEEFTETRP